MPCDRRTFLAAAVSAAAGLPATALASAPSEADGEDARERAGCLVDTTLCIGCRQCEDACNRRNKLARPVEPFRSKTVFRQRRRPDADAFTVVNAYRDPPSPDQTEKPYTYVKTQCMHCLDPACVSACIVGALSKAEDGAIVYNPTICIGCRYCMIACPFQIPAYEYSDPLAPRVRKCEFCTDRERGLGANPACAAACPMEAIVFGKRRQLLEVARRRIKEKPYRYERTIYGEREVGGTSWLYLVGRPHEEVGLLSLADHSPARLTEAIQHGIFRYAAIPLAVYAGLGGLMWRTHRKQRLAGGDSAEKAHAAPDEAAEGVAK